MAVLMPIRREESQLETLLDELKAFESSSKKLQSAEGLSLLDVRDIFDALITEHSGVESYLAPDAAIVQQPEFEDACISVLMGKADTLTEQQRALLLPFAAPTSPRQGVDDEELSFVDRALEKRKLQREQPSEYPEIAVIPPTSNVCERFFSQAKHALGSHRQSLLPIHLEVILFVKKIAPLERQDRGRCGESCEIGRRSIGAILHLPFK
ncbi:hypothetical protein AM587_10000113 [Phytophthora nicotianae]|uniref:HAT C-terminal dimerisation domain-containing protein n=1 Tax=Phytophthora nicotianae TaxID=4792 RepID=A0A0W8CMY7_PHYNI|nr:hypothetical protein AM587_10000113 [Phytophthora nicotianae]